MSLCPILWRPAAERDVEELAAWYSAEGGLAIELAFIDSLAAAFELIARHPAAGSQRHSYLLPELPAPLRFHPLKRFERILVYYIDMADHVEIVRVWDAARGLEALLDDTSES